MDTFFKISERNSSIGNEVIGGLTTFLAMSYIIAVNPQMLVAAGMPFEAALTATCIGAAIMTIAMGLIANRPVALASGMGINAIDSLRGNGLKLRGVGLNEKELEILGVKYAGECSHG